MLRLQKKKGQEELFCLIAWAIKRNVGGMGRKFVFVSFMLPGECTSGKQFEGVIVSQLAQFEK